MWYANNYVRVVTAALESNGPTTCDSLMEYMQYSGVSIVTVCKLWHLQPALDAVLLTALTRRTEYSALVLFLCFLAWLAVRDFPTPTTKKRVRAFLGLTGYYRKFILNYSDTATPLSELTRKAEPSRVRWSEECERAFHKFKTRLCSEPILRSADFDKEFILQTDASEKGIGAVLSQYDDDGMEHPVVFYSRKLLPRETRYSTVEKECLTIMAATHNFRVYLLGRSFTIQTDHRALEWLDRLKDNNGRQTRWSLALQPYKFVIQYRAGSANSNADGLSRAFANDPTTSLPEKEGGV